MKAHTIWHSVLWAFFAGGLLALSASAHIEVTGTSTYPADHNAVQAALTSAGSGETVVLHGTFDFGADGGIEILQPNVTIDGTGATFTGGGKLHATLALSPPWPANTYVRYVICIQAVGGTVKGLTINTTKLAGIAVGTNSTNPDDPPVVIEGNTINAATLAVYARWTGCPIVVKGNTVSAARGIWVYENTGDVTVSDNTITSDTFCTYIMMNTRKCTVTGNTAYGGPIGQGLHVCTTPGDGKITINGNTVRGARIGIGVHHFGVSASNPLPVEISNNDIEPSTTTPPSYFSAGISGWYNYCPVEILANRIHAATEAPTSNMFGLFFYAGWSAMQSLDGNNPPLLLKNNDLDIFYPYPQEPTSGPGAAGIYLGMPPFGMNNVTVESNSLSGTVTVGAVVNPYCRNILIAGNDMADLKTWEAQLGLFGREMTVKDNVFGFADRIPGISRGVELASVRPAPAAPLPYPVENCILAKNDYRLTGFPGWSATTNGCILLASYADMGGLGTEVKNNLVFETGLFPKGTGGAGEQVQELKTPLGLVHDNRIIGLLASGLTDPGIGQRLKAIGGHSYEIKADLGEFEPAEQRCMVGGGPQLKIGAASPSSRPELLNPSLPLAVELLGNYPNPFNPSTSIRYGIPTASHVRIEVYNTLGQMVTCLFNGDQPAGYHEVRFDASGLASSMYLCQLQTGGVIRTSKILLVK